MERIGGFLFTQFDGIAALLQAWRFDQTTSTPHAFIFGSLVTIGMPLASL